MRPLLLLLLTALLSGCSTLGYYWQAAQGHLSLMQAARPIDQWLDDPTTPAPLRTQLQIAQRVRHFASEQLHLPDNASYRSYTDLGRGAAVWTVVAAPPWSLQPQSWCFLVAGCVNYRGYFRREGAEQEARRLAATGLETVVLPVPAYSTLGLLNWAGGDPLLNTFLTHGEGEMARLIFHELAHQVVYVSDDTAFNESFATAVERLGVVQWLSRADAQTRGHYEQFESRRRQWRALTLELRHQLQAIYLTASAQAQDAHQAQRGKQVALAEFARRYALLRESWGGFPGYDRWAERMNNAFLAAMADYEDLVPAFEALFHRSGNWPAFLTQVRQLARLPRGERTDRLRTLMPATNRQDLPAAK